MEMTFEEIEQAVYKNPITEDLLDSRDFQYAEIVGAVELPKKFSLRKEMTGIRTQGTRGTCGGHAGCAISEYWNAKEYGNLKLDLSEEYLFKKCKDKDLEDQNYTGYGTYARSVAKSLNKDGVCLESTLPYNYTGKEDVWKTLIITPQMNEEAQVYKMKDYLSVQKDEQAIKQALVGSNSPLLMSVALFESYRGAKKGGLVPVPQTGEKRIGGHLMAAVGYDEYGIEFKNSWGSGWGDHGYIWWPWAAMAQIGASIWSFVDLINNPNVMKEQLIEQNKKLLKRGEEGIQSWNLGLEVGLLNEGSIPSDNLNKEDFVIYMKRLNLLK
jgi:C1A family cysteine protease